MLIVLLRLTESKAQPPQQPPPPSAILNSTRVDQECDRCCPYATTVMFLASKDISISESDLCLNLSCPTPIPPLIPPPHPCTLCGTMTMEDISQYILGNSMFHNCNFVTSVKNKASVSWSNMKSSINNKQLSYLSIGYNKPKAVTPFHVMAVIGYETITKSSKTYNFLLVNDPYCYSSLRMIKIRFSGVPDIKAEFPSEFLLENNTNHLNILQPLPTINNPNEVNFNISKNNISSYDISPVYVTYISDATISNNQDIVYDFKKKNAVSTSSVPITRMQLVNNSFYTPLAIFEVNKPVSNPLMLDSTNLLVVGITPSNTRYYLSNVPLVGVESGQIIPYKKVIFPPSYNEYLYFTFKGKYYYYSLADLNEDIRFGKIYEKKYFLNKLWGFYKQFF